MFGQKSPTSRRGLATVEAALVVGLLLFVVIGGIDLALQLHVRNLMSCAGREAARYLAVRGGTQEQARTAALDYLDGINANFTVTFQVESQDVQVSISVLRREISLGIFEFAVGTTMVTETTMRKEI